MDSRSLRSLEEGWDWRLILRRCFWHVIFLANIVQFCAIAFTSYVPSVTVVGMNAAVAMMWVAVIKLTQANEVSGSP